MSFFRPAVSATVVCLLAWQTSAGSLRAGAEISREQIAENLRELFGHEMNTPRMEQIKDALRPTFMALPKDNANGLDHKVARYALQRYFMVQHAWHIKGLALEPGSSSDGHLSAVLKSKMPSLVLDVMDEQLAGKELGLHELAAIAALIEDLVHSDSIDLINFAYFVHGLRTDLPLSATEADLVIRTFTLSFLVPRLQDLPVNRLLKFLQMPEKLYPGWEETYIWLKDLRHTSVLQQHRENPFHPHAGRAFAGLEDSEMDFLEMAQWASDITVKFGRNSDRECKVMRSDLLQLDEEMGPDGRIRLGKFYSPTIDGHSIHFSESPEYLRHLGALDESDPRNPRVIVPNILYSRSNCLATSGFQSVCCVDDCQMLMTQVEEKVSRPTATPAVIGEAVGSISSEFVLAPRQMSSSMMKRLEDIATRHGGEVPLHGRLFAQWMHYAFPNECAYPQSLLTSESPMSASEWATQWNKTKSPRATQTEMLAMKELLDAQAEDASQEAEEDGTAMLWSDDEQLLNDDSFKGSSNGWLWNFLRAAAMLAVIVATGSSLYQTYLSGSVASKKKCEDLPLWGKDR